MQIITFSREERARIAVHCKALGTKFHEFVHDASMQIVDELDGVRRERAATDARVLDAARLIREHDWHFLDLDQAILIAEALGREP